MAGSLLPEPKQQFLNDIGDPLFAGQIFTYAAGTLTPKSTYQDQALTIANTNPVVANARGEVVMYGSGTYRVILKDSFGNTIYDRDDIQTTESIVNSVFETFTLSSGSSLIGWIQSGLGAILRTVQSKLRERVTYEDFGAVGDGVADDTAAVQTAIDAKGTVDTSSGSTYKISSSIVVPSNRTLKNSGGATFLWAGTGSTSIGVFSNTGGSNITMENPIFRNASSNNSVAGFIGISCSNVTLKSPTSYECKICLFNSSATTWAGVTTSGAGENVCRNIVVTNFTAFGRGAELHGSAVDLYYCFDWQVIGGYAKDIQFGTQFWGGDSNPITGQGILANERKNGNGVVVGVISVNGQAGVWGSMGTGIKISGCDVREMSDVGIDFEGCIGGVATGNYVADCANGNYATFFYNRNILINGNVSQLSSTRPHYRNYNVSQNNLDKSVQFIDNTCRTDGNIATIDCGFGPIESIDVSDNTLTNTIISLSANNMRYIRIENNSLLFDVVSPTAFNAINAGGVNSSGRARVNGNSILSQVTQPAGSFGVIVGTGDGNSVNYFDVSRNSVIGFPQDFSFLSAGTNAGIAPVFNFEGNVLGAGIMVRTESGAKISTMYVRDNFSGNFSHWPGAVPTTQYWNAGTRISLNTIAAGSFEGSICTTAGTPGTWKTFGAISP